jgi:serine phosphatase RsbU (regulator of sigma subunit)
MDIDSHSFHLAELRSERARVGALLIVLGSLLTLVLLRGVISLAGGHPGQAWPFALLLAAVLAYELPWLRFIKRVIHAGGELSRTTWGLNIFVESLVPTAALYLQVHTSFIGPERALTSPVVLVYLLFIILSTLHLSPTLSRWAGVFSAAGYSAVSIYVFSVFPEALAGDELLMYGTSISYAAFLLLGGFAAGAVADQIQLHVVAALQEAEHRAKIAELEHDLGIARSIQQGLLPKKPPDVAGFDIAGWNQPADETGGDYFDWQQLDDGRIGVAVADVTGHGIGSALCMAACRAYARAGLARGTDLQRFLAHMNQLLYEDLPSEKFVTLVEGVLDPRLSTLQMISAGHGPLLFYSSRDDSFHRYDAQGPPLGLLPQFAYADPQLVDFAPGDILVLITDGFVEWANRVDEDFGEGRIKEVIRTYRDMPAAKIISELYSAVLEFAAGTPQLDDLTALVVKRV